MADTVFLHLPIDEEQRLTWTGPGLSGDTACRRERLATVGMAVSGERVVAVVPGADVLLTRVQSPRTSRGNLEKAVPFLLEEGLAEPLENLHFALGQRRKDGILPVAVVLRDIMEQWLEGLREGGIQPELLLCESLLVPWEAGGWTVVSIGERSLVRTGRESGFGIETANLKPALELALAAEEINPPDQLRVVDFTDDGSLPDLTGLNIPLHREKGEGHPLPFLAAGYERGAGINLLQGSFAPTDRWSGLWRHFRFTALLVVAWLLYRGAYGLVQEGQLNRRIDTMNQRIEQTYRDAFPDARRVVDARAQMGQRLKKLQGGGKVRKDGFLFLISRVGTVLKNTSDVTLQRIRFQNGKLDLFLTVADLQRLDAIKQQLGRFPDLTATIQNASKGQEGVESHLRISGR